MIALEQSAERDLLAGGGGAGRSSDRSDPLWLRAAVDTTLFAK